MVEQTNIFIRLTADDTREHVVAVDPTHIGELHQVIKVFVDLHPVWGLIIGIMDTQKKQVVEIGVSRFINSGFYDETGTSLPGDEIVRRLNLLKSTNQQ